MLHINSILNTVSDRLNLGRRLKEHAVMEMWPLVVGITWAQRTRPLCIDKQSNLVVSVADASTGQELSLLKPQIMSKLVSAANSAGVELAGLRFDLKHFHEGGDNR
jgi:hypothetical protein